MADITTYHLVAQALGMLSYALGVLCFYQKNDRRLKWLMLSMNLNYVIHFSMIGAVTGAIASALSVVRTGMSLRTSSRTAAVVFIVISFSMGVYFSKHWYDIFPILGSCIGTYALFCLQGIKMRIAFLFGAASWLTNNIIVGSIGGTLMEITLIIVNLNTIRRLYFSKP